MKPDALELGVLSERNSASLTGRPSSPDRPVSYNLTSIDLEQVRDSAPEPVEHREGMALVLDVASAIVAGAAVAFIALTL